MFNELLQKINNKPGKVESASAPSGHAPDRVDILMEQVKNLIEINKTLNAKVKTLESQFQTAGQNMAQLQQQLQSQATRSQSFEQIVMKCTQVIQRLQTGGVAPAMETVNAPAPQRPPQPVHQPVMQTPTPQPVHAPMTQTPHITPQAMQAPQTHVQQPSQVAQPAPSQSIALKEAKQGNYFLLRNGSQVKNLKELHTAMSHMDDMEFSAYVNDFKNDISSWVRYCLGLEAVAQELTPAKQRQAALSILTKYLNQ